MPSDIWSPATRNAPVTALYDLAAISGAWKIVYHQGIIVQDTESYDGICRCAPATGGRVSPEVTLCHEIAPVVTGRIGLQFDEETRMPDDALRKVQKGYLLVQNRAEWKQLVAGAAHLCKERVPE